MTQERTRGPISDEIAAARRQVGAHGTVDPTSDGYRVTFMIAGQPALHLLITPEGTYLRQPAHLGPVRFSLFELHTLYGRAATFAAHMVLRELGVEARDPYYVTSAGGPPALLEDLRVPVGSKARLSELSPGSQYHYPLRPCPSCGPFSRTSAPNRRSAGPRSCG